MAILNCNNCGSVITATFEGDGGVDPDSWLVEDIEFSVTLDPNGNPIIVADPNHATTYSKLNVAYWNSVVSAAIQSDHITMCCGCGDEVEYDTQYTQLQAPPQQPQAPTPPPSVAGILGGGQNVAGIGLSGGSAPIQPPSGGLPDPPAVPSTPEVEDKGTQHAPTVLGLSKEVLERLEKLKDQPLSPSDGFSPPRRNK